MRWLAVGEHDLPGGDAWLSEAERGRLAGLRFTKRRREYLLRRFAGKLAVAAATGRSGDPASLAEVEVLNHASGAPWVRVAGRRADLEVSLTDRAGWAVCLVTDPDDGLEAVGVDLELVEPRSPGFVQDFLTVPEQRYVAGQPDEESRHAAANLLWSAKESALKVLRVGLRADTRSVEVRPQHDRDAAGWCRLRVDGGTRQFPGWWRRDGVFVLTIATARPTPPPARLPGGADLAEAVPVHSWLADPLHG